MKSNYTTYAHGPPSWPCLDTISHEIFGRLYEVARALFLVDARWIDPSTRLRFCRH